MNTIIMHLDLDTFFVSCERLHNPSLNGKPVIVGGYGNERGVVAACSYEARKFGIYSSMPLKWAQKACPNAIFIPGNFSLYSDLSKKVAKIIQNSASEYEQASVDEFYLDLSGFYKFVFDHPMQFAEKIKNKISNELGLPSSIGIGQNRLIAKIGSKLAKPAGIFYCPAGSEEDLLGPLPVEYIPGIGDSMQEKLNTMGILLLKDLQKVPVDVLEKKFGKWGRNLHFKSLGKSSSEVSIWGERKSVSSESTFPADTDDVVFLKHQLLKCVEEVGYTLRNEKLKSSTLTVKLRDHKFQTHTLSKTISFAIQDDHSLFDAALKLFSSLHFPMKTYRLIGFNASRLENETDAPANLFAEVETNKAQKLFEKVDLLKKKYGKSALELAGYLPGKQMVKSHGTNSLFHSELAQEFGKRNKDSFLKRQE